MKTLWLIAEYCPGPADSRGTVPASSPQHAAEQAFDAVHLRLSNMMDAFTEALKKERKHRRDWFWSLPTNPGRYNLDVDCQYCPCGRSLQIFPNKPENDAIDKWIETHFAHRDVLKGGEKADPGE